MLKVSKVTKVNLELRVQLVKLVLKVFRATKENRAPKVL